MLDGALKTVATLGSGKPAPVLQSVAATECSGGACGNRCSRPEFDPPPQEPVDLRPVRAAVEPAAEMVAQAHQVDQHRRHRQAGRVEQAGADEAYVDRCLWHWMAQRMAEGGDGIERPVGEGIQPAHGVRTGDLLDQRFRRRRLVVAEFEHHSAAFAGLGRPRGEESWKSPRAMAMRRRYSSTWKSAEKGSPTTLMPGSACAARRASAGTWSWNLEEQRCSVVPVVPGDEGLGRS